METAKGKEERKREIRTMKKETKFRKMHPFITVIPTKTETKGLDERSILFEVVVARRSDGHRKFGFESKDYSYMKVDFINDPVDQELHVIGSFLRIIRDEEENQRSILIHVSHEETIDCLFGESNEKKSKREKPTRREYYVKDILGMIRDMEKNEEKVEIRRRDW